MAKRTRHEPLATCTFYKHLQSICRMLRQEPVCFDSQRPSGFIIGQSDETKASVSSTMVNWNLQKGCNKQRKQLENDPRNTYQNHSNSLKKIRTRIWSSAVEQWHSESDSSTKHDVGKRPGRFENLGVHDVHVDAKAIVVRILAVHLAMHLHPGYLIHPKRSQAPRVGPKGIVQICIRHLRS